MSWFKMGRWLLVCLTAVSAGSACGGRGNLPTGAPDSDDSGGQSLGGANSTGASAGAIARAGRGSFGGTVAVGGAVGVAGTANVGGGPGICVPGRGMCEGNTVALCAGPGGGYVLRDCGMGQRCVQRGDVPSCELIPVVCKPGQMQCDAAGTFVQVCSPDGTSLRNQLNCGAQGQRCQGGVCRSLVCEPNQLYCDKTGVRLCNADGSASTARENCQAGQYCDAVALVCRKGICAPGQPACNGSIATTCNANGSGYLPRGIDCGGTPDRQCVLGACLCPPNLADCDGEAKTGCEANVSTDPDNCTGCGVSCSNSHVAQRTCDDGCNGTCSAGFQDCNGDKLTDGCETKTGTDVTNCGGCGIACSLNHVKPQCKAGACAGVCAAGFDDCNGDKRADGCEINTQTDAKNCGGCGNVCPAGGSCAKGQCDSVLAFTGIAQNVPIDSLTGWSQCYAEAYGEAVTSMSDIKAACTGSLLMMACRPVGSNVLQLAAYAPRADVLFDTGSGNEPHEANGVGWYFNGSQSWGFAPSGDAITRNSCDTQDSSADLNGKDGDLRLCWHTGGDFLQGGWRCGYNDGLNNSFTYERLLFQAP